MYHKDDKSKIIYVGQTKQTIYERLSDNISMINNVRYVNQNDVKKVYEYYSESNNIFYST